MECDRPSGVPGDADQGWGGMGRFDVGGDSVGRSGFNISATACVSFASRSRGNSEPAWKSKPSWYLLVTEDRMIPPPAQRFMSARAGSKVVEVGGSHAIYVSQPNAVASLIKQAAQGVVAATAAH